MAPGRASPLQTLELLPGDVSVRADRPARPGDGRAPTVEQRTYPYAGGTVNAQLFQPAGPGQHGAIMLMLGAGDLPESDLAVHFAEALARLGIVTLIPESSGMLAEQLSVDEVDAVRTSLNLLRGESDVDAGRIGLVGLSASGAISIVAAAQPDLRDEVRFVNSFGSYDDAATLLLDVASRSMVVDGQTRPWQPESRTVEVVNNALVAAGVDAGVRAELVAGRSRAADQRRAAHQRVPHDCRPSAWHRCRRQPI